MKHIIFIITLLITAPAVSGDLLLAQDTSCGLVWGAPIQLAKDSMPNNLPEICAQGETIHITWRAAYGTPHNNFKLPYARSTNGGVSFEPTRELLPDSSFLFEAPYEKIVANKTTAFIFFCGSTNGSQKTPVFMMRSFDAGTTWSTPVPINNDSTGVIRDACIMGDTLAVIYWPWTSEHRVFTCSTNGGDTWFQPTLFDLGFGYNRIVFTAGILHHAHSTSRVEYYKSTDLGETWSDTVVLSTNDGQRVESVNLGISNDDPQHIQLYTAWLDNKYGCGGSGVGCTILFRQSLDLGSEWSEEMPFTKQPDGYPNGNFAALRSRVGFVWTKDVTPSNFHVQFRYSIDYGESWSDICFPSGTSPTDRSGELHCAVSSSAFHIVWWKGDGGDNIMYRRGAFMTDVKENENTLPKSVTLKQNYPNPFNPSTAIGYSLLAVSKVILKVYNIYGQEVAMLVNKKEDAGEHSVQFNGEQLPSGLYFYRLSVTGNNNKITTVTKKMILIK